MMRFRRTPPASSRRSAHFMPRSEAAGAPSLDETIHNATTAQRLYDAAVALPLFPTGVMNCAADTGETYTLDFTREQAPTLDVVAHPSGCEQVTITGLAARRATASFWSLLRQIAQAPHS